MVDLTMSHHDLHLHQLMSECTMFKIVQKRATEGLVAFVDASRFMMGVYNVSTVTKEGVLSEVKGPWRLNSMHCVPQFRSLWMWSTGMSADVQNCGRYMKLRRAPQTFAQLSATSLHFVAPLLRCGAVFMTFHPTCNNNFSSVPPIRSQFRSSPSSLVTLTASSAFPLQTQVVTVVSC